MQDRKALQSGTSHFLGQNFAKASNIQFLDTDGQRKFAWTTSWGVSTRLIGGLVMCHSDDDGLVLPPRLAPAQVVILPITFKAENPQAVMQYCQSLRDELRKVVYHGRPLEVEIDARDLRGGEKVWSWVKKGVPIRLEIGPRDIEQDAVFMARRDQSPKDKQSIGRARFVAEVAQILDEVQQNIFERARRFRDEHTRRIDSPDEFRAFFTPKNAQQPEPHGGFALAHWSGDEEAAQKAQEEMGVTIRCIPFDSELADGEGRCILTGKPSKQRVVWAKAY